jgi:hypothetical protein
VRGVEVRELAERSPVRVPHHEAAFVHGPSPSNANVAVIFLVAATLCKVLSQVVGCDRGVVFDLA